MKHVSGKQLCKVLEKHGWHLERVSGSHRIYKKAGHGGSISIPVHGNKTLKSGTQKGIMREAGLTDDDL